MKGWIIAIIVISCIIVVFGIIAIIYFIQKGNNSTKLPDYEDASVLLSLRKLNPNYDGPAVAVQTTDGKTEGDIEFDGDAVTDTSFSDFFDKQGINPTDLQVTKWYNQASDENNSKVYDFTTNDTFGYPLIFDGTNNTMYTDANGKPQIYFDSTGGLISDYNPAKEYTGSDDFVAYSINVVADDSINNTTELLVGIAMQSSSGGTYHIGVQPQGDSNGERKIFYNGGVVTAYNQTGAQFILGGYVKDADDGDQFLYNNNILTNDNITTGTSNDLSSASEGMSIGFTNTKGVITNPFTGYIQEIIFYPMYKGDKQSSINKSINNYYKIESSSSSASSASASSASSATTSLLTGRTMTNSSDWCSATSITGSNNMYGGYYLGFQNCDGSLEELIVDSSTVTMDINGIFVDNGVCNVSFALDGNNKAFTGSLSFEQGTDTILEAQVDSNSNLYLYLILSNNTITVELASP